MSHKTNHTNTSFLTTTRQKKMATGAQGNELRVSFSNTVRTQEMLQTNPDYLSRSFITVILRRLKVSEIYILVVQKATTKQRKATRQQ